MTDEQMFDEALDHVLSHGPSGGGPAPECRWCLDDEKEQPDG